MSSVQNEFNPNYSIHPGAMLQEWLDERGLTQIELAERTGRTAKSINELVQGKAPVSPETALQLERVTGVPASLWNNMEVNYRTHLARLQHQRRLEQMSSWAKCFSYAAMARLGWVSATRDPLIKAENLLKFFGVVSPVQWEITYGSVSGLARQSTSYCTEIQDLTAWLRQGENLAAEIPCPAFDEALFKNNLSELRLATREEVSIQGEKLFSLCFRAGVAFVVVPELPKTHVSGFTRWLTPTKAIIQQSLRHKRNDYLWFTFFHEAAHLLLHGKKERFLEIDQDSSQKEKEANRWAEDFLIPRRAWETFVSTYRGKFYESTVAGFAQELRIAPAIVAGRLQRERLAEPGWYKRLFLRLELSPHIAREENEDFRLSR